MKNYSFLIILLYTIICYGQKLQRKDDLQNKHGYLRNYDEEYYIGNPDDNAIIERPCPVYDLNCIREFFAKHSKCKIRRGPLPRSLFISQETLYFTRVNLTVTPTNLMVGSFGNTRIEEFYINRRTNKMVFSINIRGFATNTFRGYFRFFRSAREPIVILSEAGQIFSSVTFTTIIPNINDLQLDKAEITPYADSMPAIYLGPELLNSTDPTVMLSVVEFLADVPTNSREELISDCQYYPPVYIQYNICDFGLSNF